MTIRLKKLNFNISELQVRRLPVVGRDHRRVGIVSLGDLALSEQQSTGAALNSISQPGESGLI